MALNPGSELLNGQYRIEREIGRGGFGFVYLARDLTPSRLEGDEGYDIRVERVPLAEFERLIAAGRLHDARVIAALYLARETL